MLASKKSYEMCYDRKFPVEISDEVLKEMKSYDEWLTKNIKKNTFYTVSDEELDDTVGWKMVKKIGNYYIYKIHFKHIKVSPFCKNCEINATCAIACFNDHGYDSNGQKHKIDFKRIREHHIDCGSILENGVHYIARCWSDNNKFVFDETDEDFGNRVYTNEKDAYKALIERIKQDLNGLRYRVSELENVLFNSFVDGFKEKI